MTNEKLNLFPILAESVLGSFEYEVPKDKREQMVDFYLLSTLAEVVVPQSTYYSEDQTPKGYTSYGHADSINMAFVEARKKLLTTMRKQLLIDVYDIIQGEMEHLFDGDGVEADISEIISDLRTDARYATNPQQYEKVLDFLRNYSIRDERYTEEEIVEMDRFLFSTGIIEWLESYGGDAYAYICDGWLRLNSAKNLNDIQIAIDHIYDLEHNTGNIFCGKNFAYSGNFEQYTNSEGQYVWIKTVLDWKRGVISPYEFFGHCSRPMERLAGFVLKANKNTTFEQWLKKASESPSLKKKIPYVSPNYPIVKQPQTGITWTKGTLTGTTFKNGVWKEGLLDMCDFISGEFLGGEANVSSFRYSKIKNGEMVRGTAFRCEISDGEIRGASIRSCIITGGLLSMCSISDMCILDGGIFQFCDVGSVISGGTIVGSRVDDYFNFNIYISGQLRSGHIDGMVIYDPIWQERRKSLSQFEQINGFREQETIRAQYLMSKSGRVLDYLDKKKMKVEHFVYTSKQPKTYFGV